jgi:hypothetical protein
MPDYGLVLPEQYLICENATVLTDAERAAYSCLSFLDSHRDFQGHRYWISNQLLYSWLREHYPTVADKAFELISNGAEAFYQRTLARVFAEHGESWMNLCPNCHALCRTRRARQCPRCFSRWKEAAGSAK